MSTYTFNDHELLKNVSSPGISPDGTRVAIVVSKADLEENSRRDELVLIDLNNHQLKKIGEGSSPGWSPDGADIAYEAEKDGKSGIWIYNLRKKTERFLVSVNHSAYFINHLEDKSFQWSPDGNFIAYVSTIEPSTQKKDKSEVMVTERLLYKSKGGRGRVYYTHNALNSHIWLVNVETGQTAQLTSENYDNHSITWSPDGKSIAFISNRTADPDNNQHCDLWKVTIQTKEIQRLTETKGTTFQPRWSPCGKYIAYLGTSGAVNTNDSMSDDTHMYLTSDNGNNTRCLTKVFDRRIENIQWAPDGEHLFFTAGNHGQTPLWQLKLQSGEIKEVIGGDCNVLEYSLDRSGEKIVVLKTDVETPPELYLFETTTQSNQKISSVNEELLKKCNFQDASEFWVTSFDETKVQGWIMKPANFQEGNTYPLVLVIHGGPHNMFGYEFEERMQLIAANGYGVLFINPRGSSGYGQQFSNGNLLNWGGGDYKDLMLGVDYVLEKCTWIDADRLGVTGQSYGGYMANWIITQTNRFKAAVVDGGISNLISFYGTSIYHSLIESEFNGLAYDNFELLWQWSPLKNIKNVATPTLFLHGETDNEVPATQAEEMYVALKKLGVETELALYLGEGHGWRPDLSPGNRIDLNKRMVAWFNKYVKEKNRQQ